MLPTHRIVDRIIEFVPNESRDANVGERGHREWDEILREKRKQGDETTIAQGRFGIDDTTTADVVDHIHHLVEDDVGRREEGGHGPDDEDDQLDRHVRREALVERIDDRLVPIDGDHRHRQRRHVSVRANSVPRKW